MKYGPFVAQGTNKAGRLKRGREWMKKDNIQLLLEEVKVNDS